MHILYITWSMLSKSLNKSELVETSRNTARRMYCEKLPNAPSCSIHVLSSGIISAKRISQRGDSTRVWCFASTATACVKHDQEFNTLLHFYTTTLPQAAYTRLDLPHYLNKPPQTSRFKIPQQILQASHVSHQAPAVSSSPAQ